jgi:PadR family transcriptional regulator, regulatory protein PadR
MSDVSKDLVAASSKIIILSILTREENYGYQILMTIKLLTEGGWNWYEGFLYPVLHKMERDKLISSRWVETDSGRKRKYYKITKKGLGALEKEKVEWKLVDSVLHKIWEMNIC